MCAEAVREADRDQAEGDRRLSQVGEDQAARADPGRHEGVDCQEKRQRVSKGSSDEGESEEEDRSHGEFVNGFVSSLYYFSVRKRAKHSSVPFGTQRVETEGVSKNEQRH